MQKREQLSAKLLQSNSISNVNLNETNRNILAVNYRNRSATAATIETGFINGIAVGTINNNNSNLKTKNTNMLTNSIETQMSGNNNAKESSKFLDDILSHRRKSSEVYSNSNQYTTSSTIQSLSLITNGTNNNLSSSTNVNNNARTSEERALHPDKLILDRYGGYF